MIDVAEGAGTPVDHFLAYVAREQEARRTEIRRKAEARARAIVAEARHAATVTVRAAAEEARRHCEAKLAAVRAELATRARQREQELSLVLLAGAWERLVEELRARWADRASRARWEADLMVSASRCMPPDGRTVHHPPGFTPTCRDPNATYVPDPTLEAGLRVTRGSVCLDGTLEGLLAARTRVEGRLLSALLPSMEDP